MGWKARPHGSTIPIGDVIVFQKGDSGGLNALLFTLLFVVIKGTSLFRKSPFVRFVPRLQL